LLCFIIALFFSVQSAYATDNLPTSIEGNTSNNEISLDCSSGILMKGAVTGPQTIPNTNKIIGGESSTGTYNISPLMQKEVYDLIYNPEKTELLKKAEKLGAFTINGESMLVYQAYIAADIWIKQITT
jgi:hypothetical protein